MQNFELTVKQVRLLRSLHRGTKDRRFADRIKAVILLGTGWTVAETAEVLLLDEDTISKYVQLYRQGGTDLLLKTSYQGRSSKLSTHQIEQLDHHLMEHTYLRVQDIVAYVEKSFSITYTVQEMTEKLKRLDYVCKKLKVLQGKHPDPRVQQAFIEKYETLKQTKGKRDPIYFMDGTHPRHNPVAAFGWIKRGVNKTLESNMGRKRVNINGALAVESLDAEVNFAESVNAQSTISLLSKLEAKHEKAETIYVICDNARYYRSRLVQAYLEDSKVGALR